MFAFVRHALAVAAAEVSKLGRDPTELFTRSVQPMLWLLVFGQVFSRARVIPTHDLPYLHFMAPGILAQSVLFVAIFYGISVIWERDLGILHKLLVSPAWRGSLVVGKGISAGVRGLVQASVVYGLALVMGIPLRPSPPAIAGVVIAALLGASLFSTLSLIVACLVKTRERFMGIGQLMTMPLFFASNAIYPIEFMPPWLQVVSRLNPLTYLVDILRALMVQGGSSAFGLPLDFGVLVAVQVLLVAIAARLYPKVVI